MRALWQYQMKAEPVLSPGPEAPQVDKWFQPASEVLPSARAAVAVAVFLVAASTSFAIPSSETLPVVPLSWLPHDALPPRGRPPLVSEGLSEPPTASALPFDPLDWLSLPNLPTPPPRPLVPEGTTFAYCPNPTPYGQVFEVDHEEGDFSDYDAVFGSGNLSVDHTAAQAVTDQGLNISMSGPTAYGLKHLDWRTRDLRFRFHMNTTDLSMTDGDAFIVIWGITSTGFNRFNVQLVKDAGFPIRLTANVTDDAVGVTTSAYDVSDASVYVEVRIRRATTPVASDGLLELYINGVLKETISGIDLYNRTRPANIRIGNNQPDAGTTGNLYLDEIVVRDDDQLIGAAGTLQWFRPASEVLLAARLAVVAETFRVASALSYAAPDPAVLLALPVVSLDWMPSYPDMVGGRVPLVPEGFWVGVLDSTLFPALTSTHYYRHLIMTHRRRG